MEDANQLLMDPQGTVSQEIDALKEQWNQNAEGKVAVVMDVGLIIVGAFTGKLPAKIKRGDKGAETRSEIKNQDEDKKESNDASGAEQLFSDMDEKVTEGKGVQIKTEVEEEVIHSIVGESGKGVGKTWSRTFRDATRQDSELIDANKTKYNAGKTRNAAKAIGKIGGEDEPPQPENYHYKRPIPEYTNYTEQKIIEFLRAKYRDNPLVSGEIELISERTYCDNCKAIVDLFEEEFPNIKVVRVEMN